jgi:hypothetical protein
LFQPGAFFLEERETMIRIYWNYFWMCIKVFFLLKECKSFLKRENLLGKRRHHHITKFMQGKLNLEKSSKGDKKVNRQDMLILLLAETFYTDSVSEMKEELTDFFAILAICACEPEKKLDKET